MRDFALLFRYPGIDLAQVSKEEIQKVASKWKAWKEGIGKQGKLESEGSQLGLEGKVLKPGGVVSDGPFVEIRERLGGFIIVKAENMEEAITLAHGCPVLELGGSVEVRPLF